jgi:hypothetical protein
MTALAIQKQYIAFYSERLLSKPLNIESVKRKLEDREKGVGDREKSVFDVDILSVDLGIFLTGIGRG